MVDFIVKRAIRSRWGQSHAMLPARAKKTNHFVAFFQNPVTGCFGRFKQTPGSLLRCKSRSGLLKHEISLLKGLCSRNLGDVKHLSTGYSRL